MTVLRQTETNRKQLQEQPNKQTIKYQKVTLKPDYLVNCHKPAIASNHLILLPFYYRDII